MSQPNYINPQTRQPLILWANIIFNSLAFLAVVMRVMSRWGILRKMNSEDWCIVAAMGLALVQAGALVRMLASHYGIGLHLIDIRPENIPGLQLWGYISGIFYNPVLMLTRTSIILFFLRIFPHKGFRLPAYLMLFFVNGSGLSILFSFAFGCMPIAAAWESMKHPGYTCIDMYAIAIANAILNTITDVGLFILPIPLLIKVKLKGREKVAVLCVFGLGIVAVMASAVRIRLMQDAVSAEEPLWDAAVGAAYTQVEVTVGIICACLPAIRHLLGHIFPHFFGNPADCTASEQQINCRETRTPYSPSTSRATRGICSIGHSHGGGGSEVYILESIENSRLNLKRETTVDKIV